MKTNEKITNITTWGDRGSLLDSQYGTISYEEWCQKEAARISANGREAVVLQRGGSCCVARK